MLHSLKAQIDYYHDYINRNPEWVFAGIYGLSEEGLCPSMEPTG